MNGSWKRNKKVEGHMKVHNLFSTGTSNILIAWGQGFMQVAKNCCEPVKQQVQELQTEMNGAERKET